MKPFEEPKKKKINRRLLDSVIEESIDDGSFTITVSDGDKSTDVTFKRFLHPILRASYYNAIRETSIKPDGNTGCMIIDEVSLTLATHMFIFGALSSMPSLKPDADDDGESKQAIAVGSYGEYFRSISKEYAEMYSVLYSDGYQYCETLVDLHNKMVEANYARLDMSTFVTHPEVLEMVKSVVLSEKSENAPVMKSGD